MSSIPGAHEPHGLLSTPIAKASTQVCECSSSNTVSALINPPPKKAAMLGISLHTVPLEVNFKWHIY